jgi:uncharacterized membrane protein
MLGVTGQQGPLAAAMPRTNRHGPLLRVSNTATIGEEFAQPVDHDQLTTRIETQLAFSRLWRLKKEVAMSGYYFKLYLLTVPVFFAIDLLWLGVVAKNFYQNNLAHLLSPTVNWPAALFFYFIYIAGIIVFAVRPGLEVQSLAKATLWGALFGFFTYATYDLTNLATLRDWPIKVVVTDILWGIVLCSLVASASYLLGRWLD